MGQARNDSGLDTEGCGEGVVRRAQTAYVFWNMVSPTDFSEMCQGKSNLK